jgi:hypothetical protein
MICQISNVKTKTGAIPPINKGLAQARNIQARLKNHAAPVPQPLDSWTPITAGPYLVPVTRWVE